MSLTKIKFCGIKNIKSIKFCIKMNIDAIGFVFCKKSLRNISINKAIKISKLLKNTYIYKFAIVYKAKTNFLKKIFKKINIDFLQYYGKEKKETIKTCQKYNVKFVKVYKFNNNKDLEKINNSKYKYISIENKSIGGTGKTIKFNKNNIKNIKKKIMISGGLNKKNIYYVIRKYKPTFVDISSGIEKNGIKNNFLMKSILKEINYSNIKNVSK